MQKFSFYLIAIIVAFIFNVVAFSSTHASSQFSNLALWDKLESEQQDLFSQNNIIFYDPTECIEGPSESKPGGTINITGGTMTEKIWSGLTSFLTKEQAAGVMGNMQNESNFNPARHETSFIGSGINIYTNKKASYGIGLIQWSFGRRVNMLSYVKSKNKSLTKYFDAPSKYSTSDPEKFLKLAPEKDVNDLISLELEFLRDELKNVKSYSGFLKTKTVSEAAEYFLRHVEIAADIEGQVGTRTKQAQAYYDKFAGSSSTASTSSSTSTEAGSESTNSGDAGVTINDVAIKLAWPEGSKHDRLKPNSEYRKALDDRGASKSQDACAKIGNSCDMFVSTVLYTAGVDKEMPLGAVDAQNKHLKGHPEIYEKVDNWSPSTAEPGDIQIKKDEGHIRIIVKVGNNFKIADASHCDHTGEIKALGQDSAEYDVYRARGDKMKEEECDGAPANGNMDLNKTAIELAWPKGEKHGAQDPKPAYVKALDKVFGKSRGGCEQYGANCGMFVDTVVRYSGADPGFGKSSGGKNYDGWAYSYGLYMLDHPELYEDVTDGYGKDTMRAGDIQIMKGNGWDNRSRPNIRGGDINHARMVIQYTDGKFYIAEASQCQRTAEINGSEYNGKISKHTKVFRLKTSVQSSISTASSADPSKSNGSMSISKTALELAWPKGTACTDKSTPEYFKARMAVGISTHTTKQGKYPCAAIGASCDKFVGVVIRYSGIDPKAGKDVCEDTDTGENCIVGRALARPDIYEEVTDGYSDETAQDGDILARSGHAWVLAKLPEDGKLYRVEASYGDCCTGRVTSVYKYSPTESGQKVRMFRAKNQSNATNCCKTDGEDGDSDAGGGVIKDGGYSSKSEADNAVMEPYRKLGSGITKYGAVDVGCTGGITSNCSAFSTYFVNRYFGTGATQVSGSATVKHLIGKGWKDGGRTPTVYAVFSQNASACGINSNNHTGVVLGINKAKDEILIGEAGCSSPASWTGVHAYSLKCFSKAPFTYAHPPGAPKGGISL